MAWVVVVGAPRLLLPVDLLVASGGGGGGGGGRVSSLAACVLPHEVDQPPAPPAEHQLGHVETARAGDSRGSWKRRWRRLRPRCCGSRRCVAGGVRREDGGDVADAHDAPRGLDLVEVEAAEGLARVRLVRLARERTRANGGGRHDASGCRTSGGIPSAASAASSLGRRTRVRLGSSGGVVVDGADSYESHAGMCEPSQERPILAVRRPGDRAVARRPSSRPGWLTSARCTPTGRVRPRDGSPAACCASQPR